MRFSMLCTYLILLALTGCVGSRPVPGQLEEYVEIDNPACTMTPNAPATIWVPKRYVESGIPRGGEVLKMGYEKGVAATSLPPPR